MLPEVREVRLDNGFLALLVERHNLPVVASTMWYRVGARDEQTGESGLSHFIEHMMFKGTVRYRKGEIDLLTSKMGGSNNAFTDHDNTCYYFSLPAERWETALDIEASRMRGCLFEPSEFEAEKSVVLEELAMGQDDPWSRLFQKTESIAYERHPYHRPIIGWREELEMLSVDRMRDYYRRHYGVNRAFMVIVGSFDADRTEAKLRQLFGDKPRAGSRPPVIAEPDLDGERRAVIHAPGDIARVAFACHTCRIGEHDDFVFDVIAQIFGQSKSSRLHRRMTIDEPLASQVGVHNDVRFDPGLFWVYSELVPGVLAARGEAAMRDEMRRLVDEGVTDEEVERALTQIRSSFLFEDESVMGTALKFGRFEASTARGYRLAGDVEAIYSRITPNTVRETMARYFAGDGWTVVWSLPESVRDQHRFASRVDPRKLTSDATRPKIARAKKPAAKRKSKSAKSPKSVEGRTKKGVKKSEAKQRKGEQKAAKKERETRETRQRKEVHPSVVRLDRRRKS
ncbi:MAG: insulinase family protein [Planctomycetes bacterium]|nr:insulinase family protein [Planctomycetota bacterium]